MVIGPNKFFLNYISNVLPDLDAGSALQFTYEELAAKFIGEKIIFEDSTKKLADIISKNVDYDYITFKMSIKYKELLDNYLNKVENALFSRDGFIINNIIVLDRDYIFNVYKTINGNSVNQRAIMTAKVIANRIKNDTSFYDELKKKIDKEIIDEENIEKKKKLQAKFLIIHDKLVSYFQIRALLLL
jgi:DNA helicase-2/ATP-dependent DNA helicase PcrA